MATPLSAKLLFCSANENTYIPNNAVTSPSRSHLLSPTSDLGIKVPIVGRRADMANCPHMEKKMKCTRPREVQINNSAESYYEITRENPGQEVA